MSGVAKKRLGGGVKIMAKIAAALGGISESGGNHR